MSIELALGDTDAGGTYARVAVLVVLVSGRVLVALKIEVDCIGKIVVVVVGLRVRCSWDRRWRQRWGVCVLGTKRQKGIFLTRAGAHETQPLARLWRSRETVVIREK